MDMPAVGLAAGWLDITENKTNSILIKLNFPVSTELGKTAYCIISQLPEPEQLLPQLYG